MGLMSNSRMVFTVDSHTQGEPTRLVVGGIIHYPGKTMREKQNGAYTHFDAIRKSLMGEPRGHKDMYGGFITPPTTDTGDLGILFMDNYGFMDMCGHGTIGLCTTVVELGMVTPTPPKTKIEIDTPVGRVTGFAHSEDGRVKMAMFLGVPSFCTHVDAELELDGVGKIEVGIAYGGNLFVVVPAASLNIDLGMDNSHLIRKTGMQIKDAVNDQYDIRHPGLEDVSGVNIVTFVGPSSNPDATYKNVHVFSTGQIDRSPGGTGTSAMLAYMYKKGDNNGSEPVTAEGFAGGLFTGRIVDTWKENGLVMHRPEISGSAFLTGVNQFIINADDPMREGLLRV